MNSESFSKAGIAAPISRRTALRLIGIGGIAVATPSLLAACAPSSAPAATGAAPVVGGTLRLGIAGGHPGTILDPHVLLDGFDSFFGWMFYEQVGRFDGTFDQYNVLADEITPNADAAQWVVRLKEGIEFHNGKTLDADDLIYSFNRVLDPATGAVAAGNLGSLAQMTKLDPRTVQFDMNGPHGWFDQAISDGGALGIVPVDFDVNNPVSTGPFKFVSHNAGVDTVVERFENYHGTAPLLDGVELVSLVDDDARMNALLSNQVDSILSLPAAQIGRLESDANFAVQNQPSGGFTVITMRTDQGPTADVRVRQALRLAADRDQYSQVLAGGQATAGSDLYGIFDPAYPADLVRERDLDAAKQLIADAGAEGLEMTITVPEGEDQLAQIFAQNAADIGLKVEVDVKDTNSFFTQGYLEYDIAIDYYPSSLQLTYASMTDGPYAFLNETHFSDAEYNAEFEAANAALTEDERVPHLTRMQEILFERGGFLIPIFPNQLSATSANVGGWPAENETGLQVAYGIGAIGFRTPPAS